MMGTTLPRRFEPIRALRKGSVCSTFVATDQYLGRNEVVVKVIGKGQLPADIGKLCEAFSWYRGVRHPFLSEVLDAGLTPRHDLFYVRDYHPDSEFFRSNNRESLKALVSVADFLRSVGRVHGAIKPSNVFAANGRFKISDPWIGPAPANPKQLEEEDIRFRAPEVLSGGSPSLESDLYSLGAVLYRFFSGRDPFEASDPEFLRAKYIWASPRSLGSVSHVSRRIAEIVTSLLDKDPTRRGPAFESLKNELEVEAVPALRAPAIGLRSKVEKVINHITTRRGLTVAVVEGPVGSGKSRFIEELRSSVSFVAPPSAVCETTGAEPCLNLARHLILLAEESRSASGVLSLARIRRFVEDGQEPASKSKQEEIVQDLVDSIATVGRHLRLLVLIEDIDRTSRRLTTLLERMAQQASVLELSVVVTTRPDGISSRTTHLWRDCLRENLLEVSLELLPAAETQRLSSFLALDPERRVPAERRAGGNPGFLEELCKGPSPTALPKKVRQILSSSIAKLPARTKRVAEVLSLFEESASWKVLAGVSESPESELREAVRQLERQGLVGSDSFAIRYPDARTLLHSRIAKSKRTELHARCYQWLKEAGSNESVLADHAFEGSLFKVASDLYRELGNKSFAERDYPRAARYFCLVLDCCVKDPAVRPLDPAASVKMAKCLAAQGNKKRAKALLRGLLELKELGEDSELLSSVYSALALPTIEDSPQERIRLLRLAIHLSAQDSPNVIYRYVALATAQLSLGELIEAEKVLNQIESSGFTRAELRPLKALRGSLLMNQGNFREAARYFSEKQPLWGSPSSLSINLAVCLEQSGDLWAARQLQASALQEAEAAGSLFGQVVSLTNLGAMESKLGNIRAAEIYFGRVSTKLRTLGRQVVGAEIKDFLTVFADVAFLAIQKGDFPSAAAYLGRIDTQRAGFFFPLELFMVAMTRCDLHLALGHLETAKAILDESNSLPLKGEFFEIDRLLVEERLEYSSVELCDRLESAIAGCERLGTIYQSCRVRTALAGHLLQLGDRMKANVFAATAREVATKNGYRPLAARAMLLVGLTAERDDEKELALKVGMDEAAELGFSPLVSEFAFWIGKLRFGRSDYAGAQEYFAKSISIIARIADDLNNGDRRTYLSKASNREARDLFNEASVRAAGSPPRARDVIDREDSLFAKIYRLTAALTAASNLDAGIAMLLQALKETMNHSVAVISGTGPKATYYPIRMAVSEESRKRMMSVALSAGDKPYIAGHGSGRKQGTVIWMPILTLGLSGGIYVESAPGEASLNEREIEFLTIVATISGAAFDQLCTRAVPAVGPSGDVHGIVGGSKPITEVRTRIEIAARNAASVLIEGESGTGKELVARAIHKQSSRAKGPFIALDCGALPEGLIEAELFGAKKGAYTGAVTDRQGLFEAANQGTIFLDEIANLGIPAQAKLLRVLQEREVRMIGSMTGKAVDVRLIAATNCNLERLVRDGRFRQDLLYRLKVLHILLPPLRSRKDDIPVLATTFLERLTISNQSRKYFGPRVMEKFLRHNFPGNVRELQNAVERAFYTSMGTAITDVDLFQETNSIDSPEHYETESWFRDLTEGKENFWSAVHDRYKRRDISRERVVALIDFGLRRTGGRYKKMASMLQIPKEQYRRFMDFLRRNQCLLDFRPYRKGGEAAG